MSLHGKIVAWFIFFASLTVLLFAFGDERQSSQALRFALEAQGRAFATQLTTDVERRYERAETELLTQGHELAAGGDIGAVAEHFAGIELFRNGSLLGSYPGHPQPASGACAFGQVPFSVSFRDRNGNSYRLDAEMTLAEFFAEVPAVGARFGRKGSTVVLDRSTGNLVWDPACQVRSTSLTPDFQAALSRQVRRGEATALRPLTGSLEGHLFAIASARRPQWSAAVLMDFGEFAAPFRTLHKKYLLIMTAMAVLALLFVLHMIRHDLRRLGAIATAADAIGNGRFDVWLPPPTGDELGRLSLALGRMVGRLSATIHQIEIGRSMAAVGELATYLSHEIRNPLSSIRLNLQMLKRDLRVGVAPDDGPELIGMCLTELQRLDDVVNTVLEVGRAPDRPEVGTCDAHDVVTDTLQVMNSKLLAHGIEATIRLGASVAMVAIAPAQLKSMLINLILNAIEAMSETKSRRITISSALIDVGEGVTRFELRIMDTGPGVPAHLRERIFEPFFTTKSTGSGIGLATALRTAVELGGRLRCESASEWSGGAEFVLELPLAVPPAAKAATGRLAAAGA